MSEFFEMPKLGMDMEEGSIVKWLKFEGDFIKKGEAIAEIETDKSSVEIESPAEGILLKQYYPEGTYLSCGTPIAFIGAAGDAIPDLGSGGTAESVVQNLSPAATTLDEDPFFRMPKLGMDMEEGTIVRWLKAEGAHVEKGEALAEIETDKSTVEVESPLSGVILKLYYAEGATVPCNQPIAAIGQPGSELPTLPCSTSAAATEIIELPVVTQSNVVAQTPLTVASEVPEARRTPGGRIRTSPRALRLAAKYQIELSAVTGTGAAGRIIEQDVRAYMEQGVHTANKPVQRIPNEMVTPLIGVRKVTARRMRQSLSNTAQANHRVDVYVSNLLNFRQQVNARLEQDGIKVSIADILTVACAKALIEHPMANASLLEDGLHIRNYANIGIATDTEKGLVVPIIRDVDILTLSEVARCSRGLIDKARKGALRPDDMVGGTFTISNLGMYEIDSFTAVLNPPETCILAVGRIKDSVVMEAGQMIIRPIMNLCLTYDHQVLDGAPAARFLQTIKHYIENPVWLMI